MISEIKSGAFFVFNEETNSFEKFGEITEAELTSANEEPEISPSEKLKYFNKDFAASFETTIENFNKYTFYLLIGEKYRIPNNWLKHHGQPMNRRTFKRTTKLVKQIKRYRRWKKKHDRTFLEGGKT